MLGGWLQAASSSGEAADAVANTAAAANRAELAGSSDADEELRTQRLRQAIMGDLDGAAETSARPPPLQLDTKSALDSPANSFSRWYQWLGHLMYEHNCHLWRVVALCLAACLFHG